MLDISWPELENIHYGSSLEESEKKMFQLSLFRRLREKLNPQEKAEDTIDIVLDNAKKVLQEGWDTLKTSDVLFLVELILDFVLPSINLPGPDFIVRPLVKKAILSSVKSLSEKLLGI